MSYVQNGYLHQCEDSEPLVQVKDASAHAVETVLSAPPDYEDGRSQWLWIRLPNGDVVLGVFPQGETYCEFEGEMP